MPKASEHAAALAIHAMMRTEGYAPDAAREYVRRAMEACGFLPAAAADLADDAEMMFAADPGSAAASYRDAAMRALAKAR